MHQSPAPPPATQDQLASTEPDRFRTLAESLPIVAYLDTPGEPGEYAPVSVWVSPRIRELTGYTADEWLARQPWEEVLHPDDREAVVADHRQFVTGHRERWECEYRLITKSGDTVWVRDVETLVFDGQGHPVQRQGSWEDITVRKQEQLRLARSEELHRLLAQSVPGAGFLMFDRELRYTFAAGHLLEQLQLADLVGRPVGELLDDPQVVALARDALSGLSTVRTLIVRNAHVDVEFAPVHDRDGAVMGGIMVGRDVTERHAAQAALRDSEARRERVLAAMLRAEDDQRSRIATDLHDDTVQVMTAALLSLDRMLAALEREDVTAAREAAAGYRETLLHAMERARRLMFELRPPTLEAAGLAAALGDLLDEAGRENGFTPHVECSTARYTETVESLVYRAVAEGVANIRKHAEAANVWLVCREHAGRLEVSLRDDGRGYDPAAQSDRERRLHLGLDAIAERVRLAGGRFAIDSAVGEGTLLSLSLPLTSV